MNNWTTLHKHSQRTSLCIRLIPLFETVTPVVRREVLTGEEEY